MSNSSIKELSFRALLIGSIISVVLGAANAYLGLKAGMTIAATYPAAVISMAVLRLMKGNILEENIARTIGSIGESVAAGAIFTIPSFFIAGIWDPFFTRGHYIISSVIMIIGGFLGVAFISLIRKVMVEDKELPYPESVAAAEIHKAGSDAARNSKFLFAAMGGGALIKLAGELMLFPVYWEKFIIFTKQTITGSRFLGEGGILFGSPGISPAYFGVGYIIGPKLGALNFSGTLIAWGLLIPMFLFLLGPSLNVEALAVSLMAKNPELSMDAAVQSVWSEYAYHIWKFIVRPIAIGGMLVSAVFTLYRMRKTLSAGLARSFRDVRIGSSGGEVPRHEKDMNVRWIALIGILGAASVFILSYFVFQSGLLIAAVSSTIIVVLAFFLSAIAGYIVGIIGSSNNPISGLTLTALVITALILLLLGATGTKGIAVVLAVAAVVCIGAAVAGEMLQDLKVGYLLQGTPSKMQFSNLLGVVISGSVLFIVLAMLNQGDIAKGLNDGYAGGFGSKNLPAPQASMIAMLAKGIIHGNMSWMVIIAGMLMGLGFIAMQVKSPMLVFIGMYLPIETTFAIFIGGLIKGITDYLIKRSGADEPAFARAENTGVLLASGLIAGEALMGLVIAFLAVGNVFMYKWFSFFANPPAWISIVVLILLSSCMVYFPYRNRKLV